MPQPRVLQPQPLPVRIGPLSSARYTSLCFPPKLFCRPGNLLTPFQTERSHEENQERAYIAASRRSDRSLEARVQSARMASEIHKKRTGKSFRISEEIVQKEEMYEEEEDDFPRSYRLLGSHMQTASAEMNSKLEAYMSSRLAMSAYMSRMNDSWRENNINQMFAAAFPNLGQQAQHLGNGMFPEGGQPQSPQPSVAAQNPLSPTFEQVNYQQASDRNQSLSTLSPTAEHNMSPSEMTHVSSPSSPALKEQAGFNQVAAARPHMSDMGRSTESPFTAELPQEMKLLLGGPPSMEMTGFGQDMYGQSFMPVDQSLYSPDMPGVNKLGELETGPADMYGDDDWDFLTQTQNQPQGMDEPWDTFINDSAWDNSAQ